MRKKTVFKISYMLYMALVVIISYLTLLLNTAYVKAETVETNEEESTKIDDSAINGDYDYTQYERHTQSFYMPQSYFASSYDYEEYCKKMYRYGYMDSNYNWTDDAETYINNPNEKNYEILDKNAKQTIQDRIDRGIMNAEDNPYLTYEEKQAIIKQKEQEENQQSDGDGTNDDESIFEQEASVTPEITEYTEQPEQAVTKVPDEEKQETTPETNKLGKTISYTIIVLVIAIIAAIAYSIYRRQF